MKLEGIHHITAITGDAQRNVDFYAGTLGLRMVKKTVNQDEPSVYHLFYADEQGDPGSDITFFEFPRRARGPRRRRDGPPDRLAGRLGRGARLLGRAARPPPGSSPSATATACASPTRRGSSTSSSSPTVDDAAADRRPPRGPAPSSRCRASTAPAPTAPTPSAAPALLEQRSSSSAPTTAGRRAATTAAASGPTTSRPPSAGSQGAGTVHHIAWASEMDEHLDWRERAIAGGAHPTPVIDRFWFRSIYFREPSGVLFEIATLGPGLRRRRGSRAPGREADPAAVPRGPARADRGRAHAGRQPARRARADERRAGPQAARAGGRARRARWSSTTAAAPTRTTSTACSTSSIRSGGCSGSRRARRSPNVPPGGRHWYLVPRVGYPDPATFAGSYAALTGFLDGLLAERGHRLGRGR